MTIKSFRPIALPVKLYDRLEETAKYLGYDYVEDYAAHLLMMTAHEQEMRELYRDKSKGKD